MDVARQHFSFSAWRATPRVMPGAHVHSDIELNYFLTGGGTYFLAGRIYPVAASRLTVFWAGIPHWLTAVEPGTEYLCMTLPLAWFLAWRLEGGPGTHVPWVGRLLEGELVQEADPALADLDRLTFARWTSDLTAGGAEGRRIALLEVEARMRRLAQSQSIGPTEEGTRGGGVLSAGVAAMTDFIGRRYADPLTVAEIAAAAGWNPNYAMTAFREAAALSLWEYVTRLRVSHAQRLLLTTDWTVERIAQECGFGSSGRFHAAFRRIVGRTPRGYRVG